VLQVVQSLGKLEFTLADVYAHATALAKLHPGPFSFLVSSLSALTSATKSANNSKSSVTILD
jgi:hypothetical protein